MTAPATPLELHRPQYVVRTSRRWLPFAVVTATIAILASSIALLLLR